MIVDHCSFSWATDENLSVGGPRFDGGAEPTAWRRHTSHDITYSHNLIYEGLGESVHEKGEHSKGTLVHDNATGILLLGNLYASNRERNALFKGGVHAAMVNNLIYNPGAKAVHYNLVAHEWGLRPWQTGQLALVGNVLRHGPDTRPGTPLFALGGAGDVELHLHDNLAFDDIGRPVPMTGRYTASTARILPRWRGLPAAAPGACCRPNGWKAKLPLAVGARPWDRDPIDFKLLSDVAEGRGRIPDSEIRKQRPSAVSHATRQAFDPETAGTGHDHEPQGRLGPPVRAPLRLALRARSMRWHRLDRDQGPAVLHHGGRQPVAGRGRIGRTAPGQSRGQIGAGKRITRRRGVDDLRHRQRGHLLHSPCPATRTRVDAAPRLTTTSRVGRASVRCSCAPASASPAMAISSSSVTSATLANAYMRANQSRACAASRHSRGR